MPLTAEVAWEAQVLALVRASQAARGQGLSMSQVLVQLGLEPTSAYRRALQDDVEGMVNGKALSFVMRQEGRLFEPIYTCAIDVDDDDDDDDGMEAGENGQQEKTRTVDGVRLLPGESISDVAITREAARAHIRAKVGSAAPSAPKKSKAKAKAVNLDENGQPRKRGRPRKVVKVEDPAVQASSPAPASAAATPAPEDAEMADTPAPTLAPAPAPLPAAAAAPAAAAPTPQREKRPAETAPEEESAGAGDATPRASDEAAARTLKRPPKRQKVDFFSRKDISKQREDIVLAALEQNGYICETRLLTKLFKKTAESMPDAHLQQLSIVDSKTRRKTFNALEARGDFQCIKTGTLSSLGGSGTLTVVCIPSKVSNEDRAAYLQAIATGEREISGLEDVGPAKFALPLNKRERRSQAEQHEGDIDDPEELLRLWHSIAHEDRLTARMCGLITGPLARLRFWHRYIYAHSGDDSVVDLATCWQSMPLKDLLKIVPATVFPASLELKHVADSPELRNSPIADLPAQEKATVWHPDAICPALTTLTLRLHALALVNPADPDAETVSARWAINQTEAPRFDWSFMPDRVHRPKIIGGAPLASMVDVNGYWKDFFTLTRQPYTAVKAEDGQLDPMPPYFPKHWKHKQAWKDGIVTTATLRKRVSRYEELVGLEFWTQEEEVQRLSDALALPMWALWQLRDHIAEKKQRNVLGDGDANGQSASDIAAAKKAARVRASTGGADVDRALLLRNIGVKARQITKNKKMWWDDRVEEAFATFPAAEHEKPFLLDKLHRHKIDWCRDKVDLSAPQVRALIMRTVRDTADSVDRRTLARARARKVRRE